MKPKKQNAAGLLGRIFFAVLVAAVSGGCIESNRSTRSNSLNEYDALAFGARGFQMNAGTPKQAQGFGLAGGLLSMIGNRQHDRDVAEANKTEVNINIGNQEAKYVYLMQNRDTEEYIGEFSFKGLDAYMKSKKGTTHPDKGYLVLVFKNGEYERDFLIGGN